MLRLRKQVRRLEAGLLCLAMVGVMIPGPVVKAGPGKVTELTGRELLKLSLDYCEKMRESKYTDSTYKVFKEELEDAKDLYADTKKSDMDYRNERDALEKAKAELEFVKKEDTGRANAFKEQSVEQIVSDMGAGWTLGNTMEGHTGLVPNETLWQSVRTTKAFIKKIHDQGYNTVRIPVTWGSMIKADYSIDDKWMSRVQDIVDYCISQDMYCIINVHHDGAEQTGWLRIASDDIDSVYEKFEGVWRSIATEFKEYDEHLIFESMNEVIGDGSYPDAEAHDVKVIMNLNQIFTNVVRSTGANNAKRWLVVPSRHANIDTTANRADAFEIPKDSVDDRIFVSVHYYDLALAHTTTMKDVTFSKNAMDELGRLMEKMMTTFTSKGIPVLLGEYGVINKKNSAERAYFCEGITRMCQVTGKMVACYWDQGWYDRSKKPSDYSFALFDRKTGTDIDTTVTDGILRGTLRKGNANTKKCTDVVNEIKKGAAVVPASVINLDKTHLEMSIGDEELVKCEVEPKENNDIILWRTDDETVATVYNGKIRAKGVGVTKVSAFGKDGKIESQVMVRVSAKRSSHPVTEIKTETEEYTLPKDGYVYLKEKLVPENTDAMVTYRSSNESVATVSSIGKVVAIGKGKANITISTSSGMTKTVKVTCKGETTAGAIHVTLNAYYNDSKHNYYGEEIGQSLTISKDGKYTATFDCSKNLSAAAKKAGVKGLTNLTAIYLKDDDITKNKISVSKVEHCDITYNRIVVDGKEIPITKKEKKSALKSSGIFDTNDPINSWDGSVVDDVTIGSNHVLNFKGKKNPKKIEVTFTLSGLKFKAEETKKEVSIDSIQPLGGKEVQIENIEDKKEIGVSISPKTQRCKVNFVSSDESVIAIDNPYVETNTDGTAITTLYAGNSGDAVVTAYSEDGLRTEFKVHVEEKTAEVNVIPTFPAKQVKKKTNNKTIVKALIFGIAVILAGVGMAVAIRKRMKK